MGKTTEIAWCNSTFNSWIGCTKIGPGCDHCYAEVQDSRKRWGQTTHWGAGIPRYRTSAAYWKQPFAWDKVAEESGKTWRVFCGSLMDVFDNEVSHIWRHDLWKVIINTPHLSWLLVTKRIGNVAKMWPVMAESAPPNVRLLITVCNQEEADRDVPKLLALKCKNGISYEPALGPVAWQEWLHGTRIPGVQWIIIGAESGPDRRPFEYAWLRSTVKACQTFMTPVFVKQDSGIRSGSRGKIQDDLWIREFPI